LYFNINEHLIKEDDEPRKARKGTKKGWDDGWFISWIS